MCLAVASLAACQFDGSRVTPDSIVVPDGDVDAPLEPDGPNDGQPDAPSCSASAIAAGGLHTCAISADGVPFCWGRGDSGQLGYVAAATCTVASVNYACSASPRPVSVVGATALGLGGAHTCAATTGGAYCWGGNTHGAFGNGTLSGSTVPQLITQRAGATAVAAGSFHTCSDAAGTVKCSGQNRNGEVGDATRFEQLTAVPAIAASGTAVAAGDFTSCAWGAGVLQCWGANQSRQLDMTGMDRLVPTTIPVPAVVTQVVLGSGHRCTLFETGDAECRGSNRNGELGNGQISGTPAVTTLPLPPLAQLAASASHTCALTTAGDVYCFGFGYTPTPVKIALARPATSITSGYSHDCAIVEGGEVYCWGDSNFGQTGNGMVGSPRTLEPQLVRLCP